MMNSVFLSLILCTQVPRVDVEAVKGEVLRVSNRSCESVTLVGNTLECTVPSELQTSTRELEVEVREARNRRFSPLYRRSLGFTLRWGQIGSIIFFRAGY